MGINKRIVESIDIFPTLIELASLPALPLCEGIDQPPTTACLQGESYASVGKTAFFEPFIYKMHHFTKTGSGQT
jgi:arylsulfatase A-like enzyme